MAAAGAVDAKSAPTAPWKTANSAVFHNSHRPQQLAFLASTITLLKDEPNISRDGRTLARWGGTFSGHTIFTSSLDSMEIKAIPSTISDRGLELAFSPDGRAIAYVTPEGVFKVPIDGSVQSPVRIMPPIPGGSWGLDWADDDSLVVVPAQSWILKKISADGKDVGDLTKLDLEKKEVAHGWPQVLPGSRAVLFGVMVGNWHDCHIEVLSLDTGRRETVIDDAYKAHYGKTGHLLFARETTLYAIPFDARELKKPEEKPTAVLDGIMMDQGAGVIGDYVISEEGTLVYRPVDPKLRINQLAWVDFAKATSFLQTEKTGRYRNPKIAKNPLRLAYSYSKGHDFGIGILNVATGIQIELKPAGTDDWAPVWSPDGRRIAFSSNRDGQWNLFVLTEDGSTAATSLVSGESLSSDR